jgi:hypothetical protein
MEVHPAQHAALWQPSFSTDMQDYCNIASSAVSDEALVVKSIARVVPQPAQFKQRYQEKQP